MINEKTTNHLIQLLKNEENQYQLLQKSNSIETQGFSFHLNDQNQLELFSSELSQSITVDFSSNEIKNKINPQKAKPALVKAIEGRANQPLKILDGTAGLGSDSFVIAARGHDVTSIEQSKIIYTLLLDGLKRAKASENICAFANNISLFNFKTENYLTQTNEVFDVIYLDPMFPDRRKSAKVKKGMQILQTLLGHSSCDEQKFYMLAYQKCKKLVIKRAISNPYFANKEPTNSLKGKSNRFDIYI